MSTHRQAISTIFVFYAVGCIIRRGLLVTSNISRDSSVNLSEDKNFILMWLAFLELEMTRSKLLVQNAGSANMCLVLQAVGYHYLRLIFEANNSNVSYQDARESFLFPDKFVIVPNKKLNYSTISDWTGLDKETVRRSCKKAQAENWIKIDKQNGISVNIESGGGANLLSVHEQVRPMVENFVKKSSKLL